jgi:nitrogen fixation protein FixH
LLPLAVASNGTLAYWSGVPTPTVLVWLDRSGRMLRTVDLDVNARSPALSPDETHLAVTEVTEERESDIWRVDLARGLASRVSFSGQARYPIWSPDSDSLVYSTMRKLYRKPASGAGDESLLFEPSGHWVLFPEDWSRDGRWVLYAAVMETGWDVSAVDVTTAESRAVIDTPANEIQARLSPRGDWVAYVSDESGTWEVYVKPFPQGSGKWQVSANGGSRPLWRGDGKEIFYVDTQDTVVAVPVIGVDAFETGLAAPLFSTRMQPMLPPYRPTYAVSDDGQRFLIENLLRHSDPSTITIVLDWQAAIEGPVEGEESPPASPNRGLLQDEDRASR